MLLKELEIILSRLEDFSSPKPELEQWATPGPIAAKMAFLAEPDLRGKRVLDLGAGTGILSIAAALVGARKVVGVEIDGEAAEVFRRNIGKAGVEGTVELVVSDAADFSGEADTAIMNPPFGAQLAGRHADSEFLEKAMSCCYTAYSLHLSRTRSFISRFSRSRGWKDEVLGVFRYPLPARFAFHSKPKKEEEVDYHRICR